MSEPRIHWAQDGLGPGLAVLPELMLITIGFVVTLFLLITGCAWWGWRRLRRSVRLERGKIALRAAALPPGPRREIAGLRLRLRDELAQTERVVGEFTASGAPPGPLPGLLRRLRAAARELDSQLRLLRDEPALGFLSRELPAARTRAERIVADAQALRWTALRLDDEVDGSAEAALDRDLADEIAGLWAGLDEVRGLRRRSP